MALTNQSTQTGIHVSSKLRLDDIVRALREEVTKANEISASSQSEYKRRARTLVAGWDMEKAGKRERYLMRAAGIWSMRQQIKAKLNEADRVRKRGAGTFAERAAKRGEILADAVLIAQQLDAFRELSWTEGDMRARQQASHKKRAAKDMQLEKFFEAVGQSQFRQAFLVAEFTGCRGAELGKGVRVEVTKTSGTPTLHFFIESAKADGKKKGLDLREVVVPFPSGAAPDVKRRWLELANTVGKKTVVKLEATKKQTAGQRFTQNFRHFSTKAGVEISAYSLRHRVSAQAKDGGDAQNTAMVLGHQSTETQRHYSRRHQAGGISPSAITGVNHSSASIRGAKKRTGPPLHSVEKQVLKKSTPQARTPATIRRTRL